MEDSYVGKDGVERVPVMARDMTGGEDLIAELVEPGEEDGGNGTTTAMVPARQRLAQRDTLVREYWNQKKHFLSALNKRGEVMAAVDGIVKEIVEETDKLLGNEMIAAGRDDIVASTTISVKRVEALETAIKMLGQRQKLSKDLDIDIEHPQMEIVFRWFLDRVRESFKEIDLDSETVDMFFARLSELFVNWKNDLRAELEGVKIPSQQQSSKHAEMIEIEDE